MSVTMTTAWNHQLRDLCRHDNDSMSLERVNIPTTMLPYHREPPTKLQAKLLKAAAAVRERIGSLAVLPTEDELTFSSTFTQAHTNNNRQRGFCNWLIPGHLMIGQYPGENPLNDGPSKEDTEKHLQCLSKANISVFCSLQRETPAQDNDGAWETDGGKCYLQPEAIRRQLPRPFVQYAPLVRECSSDSDREPAFVHAPIEDLSVPECQEPLQQLLLNLLEHMNQDNVAIYVHCWGGRGRAGLVGSCLLTLIWPHLRASTILAWVQRAYATRAGHEHLEEAYAYSPQTCEQRDYVRAFVQEYQALYHDQNKGDKTMTRRPKTLRRSVSPVPHRRHLLAGEKLRFSC